jgi:hypothetical protein
LTLSSAYSGEDFARQTELTIKSALETEGAGLGYPPFASPVFSCAAHLIDINRLPARIAFRGSGAALFQIEHRRIGRQVLAR